MRYNTNDGEDLFPCTIFAVTFIPVNYRDLNERLSHEESHGKATYDGFRATGYPPATSNSETTLKQPQGLPYIPLLPANGRSHNHSPSTQKPKAVPEPEVRKIPVSGSSILQIAVHPETGPPPQSA